VDDRLALGLVQAVEDAVLGGGRTAEIRAHDRIITVVPARRGPGATEPRSARGGLERGLERFGPEVSRSSALEK